MKPLMFLFGLGVLAGLLDWLLQISYE